MQALGELPGHVQSEAYGINEKRQVVGISCDPDFVDCRAVIWENGTITDLNSLKPASYTARLEHAKDINEVGEITGRSFDPVAGRKAFLAVPVSMQ
jgi:probable HAF family extracellular repeat protein